MKAKHTDQEVTNMKQFRAYRREGPKFIYLGSVAAKNEEIAREVFRAENPQCAPADIVILEA